MKAKLILLIMPVLLLLLTVGCAKPPDYKQMVENNYDFASNVRSAVDFIYDSGITYIDIDVDNPNELDLDIWVNRSHSIDGFESIRKSRVHRTKDRSFRRAFKLENLLEGIKETVFVEILDINGKALSITGSMENFIEGKPFEFVNHKINIGPLVVKESIKNIVED